MNTTTTELAKPKEQVLATKKEQWGNYGLKLDQKETEWSLEANAIIKSLVLPERIEDVPAAETALTEAKRRTKALDEARAPFTQKMDEIKQRCMKHVKLVEPEIEAASKKILALKADHHKKQQAEQQQTYEIQAMIKYMKNHVIESEAGFKTRIVSLVDTLFTSCLNSNKTIEKAMADVEMAKSKCTAYDFIIPAKHFASTILTPEEITQLKTLYVVTDSEKWVSEFHEALDLKFSDYDVAILNKEQALKIAADEKHQAEAAINTEKVNESIAATLDTHAVVTPVAKFGRDLKTSWVIDMPETEQTAKIIDAAFMANWDRAVRHLRVTKWRSLNTGQKENALCKLKTEDSNFSFTHLVFKEDLK